MFFATGEQRRRVVCVRKEDSLIVSDIRCESSGYKKPPELIQKCNLHCSIRYLTFIRPSHCYFRSICLFVTENNVTPNSSYKVKLLSGTFLKAFLDYQQIMVTFLLCTKFHGLFSVGLREN